MMYESRDANPYYQSADADFDAARAEWERQGEPAAAVYENYRAKIAAASASLCDVCERPNATRCEHGTLTLCASCANTDDHREYCEGVQDGGAE